MFLLKKAQQLQQMVIMMFIQESAQQMLIMMFLQESAQQQQQLLNMMLMKKAKQQLLIMMVLQESAQQQEAQQAKQLLIMMKRTVLGTRTTWGSSQMVLTTKNAVLLAVRCYVWLCLLSHVEKLFAIVASYTIISMCFVICTLVTHL